MKTHHGPQSCIKLTMALPHPAILLGGYGFNTEPVNGKKKKNNSLLTHVNTVVKAMRGTSLWLESARISRKDHSLQPSQRTHVPPAPTPWKDPALGSSPPCKDCLGSPRLDEACSREMSTEHVCWVDPLDQRAKDVGETHRHKGAA